jgi:hypothetical protein
MALVVSDTTEIDCAHTKDSVAQQGTAQGQITDEARQLRAFNAQIQDT